MDELPPGRYFISHSYLDKKACERLRKSFPPGIKPKCFPPITAPPEHLVSDELIRALLDCDGLIYLEGGHSARSFWVAFERDYALRAGKPVFSANSRNLKLTRHRRPPLDLAAFATYAPDDAGRVSEVVAFLKRERHFDIFFDRDDLKAGDLWEEVIAQSLADRLRRGYAVIFWSHEASSSHTVRQEIEQAAKDVASDFNDRVLFALLDDATLPEVWQGYREPGVQLYGDAARPARHRMDDLVVRLYWLIYRKTEHRYLEEGTPAINRPTRRVGYTLGTLFEAARTRLRTWRAKGRG